MHAVAPQPVESPSGRFRADFFIPGEPVAWARPRRAKAGHFFTQDEQAKAGDDLVLLSKRHRPRTPIEGPVAVQLRFILPVPGGWAAWRREAAERGWMMPTSRPDTDNYEKAVLDALTRARFWRDDAQVVIVHAAKEYARDGHTGTWIVVQELEVIASAAEWRAIRAEYAIAAGGEA